ncbi:hypothetical protein SLE2022_091280 [Rubroshorea leprosula]
MALEALSSNEFLNFIIYDTISATPYSNRDSIGSSFSMENSMSAPEKASALNCCSPRTQQCHSSMVQEAVDRRQNLELQGRKKRRRKPRVCKSREEAETQRMTHIEVERNRRKQMNEHLAVLRSLMPESYVQRGDQASIVGGAIEFVKELEHLLQSLEAQKLQLLQQVRAAAAANEDITASKFLPPPFAQFFLYPQYTWSQIPNKQLSRLVSGFQSLHFSILHLNVTTMDPLVFYSISAKVEEGCQLISVEDIAGAVHHMLRIIDEEPVLC